MHLNLCDFIKKCALSGLASLVIGSALADPVVHGGSSSYSIRGQSAFVLGAEMSKKGPVGADGNRHPARTKWDYRVQLKTYDLGDSCTVESVQIFLGITHTRPIWRDEEKGVKTLRDRWASFMSSLEDVEKKHEEIARNAANEAEKIITDLPPQADCVALETLVDREARVVKDKYLQLKSQYEEDTDFGKTVGLSIM